MKSIDIRKSMKEMERQQIHAQDGALEAESSSPMLVVIVQKNASGSRKIRRFSLWSFSIEIWK
jgi:hypothetical protein